jgi:hypothetical protein
MIRCSSIQGKKPRYFLAFESKNDKLELARAQRCAFSRVIRDLTFVDCDADYPSMMKFERMEQVYQMMGKKMVNCSHI